MFKDGLLRDRRILVTGGGTGLGKGMAEKFLALGGEVFICGRRKSVCEATAAELMAKHGGKVTSYGIDIRDAAAVDAMVADIFASGPLTDLINNAAGNFISRTQDLSPRGFDAIANIVMHGTFYVTHAVGKRWIAGNHRGNVVSIVVTWVHNGGPYVVPSAMSKSAVHTMTMSLTTNARTWLAYRAAWRARYAVGRRRICEQRPSARSSAHDPLNRAAFDAMFKIIAVAVIGVLVGIGFFDLGQEAYTLAALLVGIGALLDYSQRRTAAPRH
jgi:NADP-dependent 3-hydroxy acid dehydrogenase YdfG